MSLRLTDGVNVGEYDTLSATIQHTLDEAPGHATRNTHIRRNPGLKTCHIELVGGLKRQRGVLEIDEQTIEAGVGGQTWQLNGCDGLDTKYLEI